MIICHEYQFIFIKTRKTAGTSTEIALSEYCGPNDVITRISESDEQYRRELGFREAQNLEIPLKYYSLRNWLRLLVKQRKAEYYNHMAASEIRRKIDLSTWNAYYKFCVVRNPFDKAISMYYWMGGEERFGSFTGFVDSGKARNCINTHLYTEEGEVIVDHIYRFEDLEDFAQQITARLGLPKPFAFPPVKAKGHLRKDKRHYSKIINTRDRAILEDTFRDELQLLDYKFEEGE